MSPFPSNVDYNLASDNVNIDKEKENTNTRLPLEGIVESSEFIDIKRDEDVQANKTSTSSDSTWFYGPSDLVHYMKTVYTPFHKANSKTVNMTIVYEKKGTTGMAGQLFGVCDSLLLGVLHNRVVKSILTDID